MALSEIDRNLLARCLAKNAEAWKDFVDRFLGCFEPISLSVYGEPTAEARAALDGFGAVYLGWLGGFNR